MRRVSLKAHSLEHPLVENGLFAALETLQTGKQGKSDAPTVVVIGWSGSPTSSRFSSLPFPRTWSPHWFLFNSRSLERDLEPYRHIAQRCGSLIETFQFDTEPHSQLGPRLESLFVKILEPFNATLCLGRIQADVSVTPNPRWNGWERTAHANGLPLLFPKTLSITGFLPSRAVLNPPSIAHYTLSISKSTSATLPADSASQSSENAIILISRALEATERVAVVDLDDGWFGLLLLTLRANPSSGSGASSSAVPAQRDPVSEILGHSDDEERTLILHVLERNSSLPFIGPLSDLVIESNHPANTIIPRVLAEHAAMEVTGDQLLATALPLIPNSASLDYQPSYNPSPLQLEENALAGDEESLIIELARLQTFSQDLPNQRVNLFKQSERIRLIAEAFAMPGLIESVASELRKDVAKSRTTTLTSIIVLRLVDDIYAGNYPLEWSEDGEHEVNRAREKKRVVRNRKSAQWDD